VYRLFIVLLAFIALPAHARRMALEPQNRVHLGLNYADTSFGFTGGLDSRLTRLVYVDVGGFMSPLEFRDPQLTSAEAPEDYVFVRHSVFVTPGIRIPHRQPDAFTWDIIGRAGFGAIWSTDVVGSYREELFINEPLAQTDPTLLGGLDLVLRFDAIGVRALGRGYYFKPYSWYAGDDLVLVRPVASLEAFYQW
jgi:hypothetical protein